MRTGLLAAMLWAAAGGAAAEVPKVAADIAPVAALVAQVMGDLGAPALIVPPGASPHGHAMRPSEAEALQEAGLVVWIGPGLTPWLEGPVATLAGQATSMELLEVPGTVLHPLREGAVFEAVGGAEVGEEGQGDEGGHVEGHAYAEGQADGEGHADGEDHDHGEEHGHGAEHGSGGHHGHDHGEGGLDPHAWLDPANGAAWLAAIADALAATDPKNAAAYRANAAEGIAALAALREEIATMLAPARGRPFVVFHDGYLYFEKAFAIPAAGAIAFSDAARPGPARLADLREEIARTGIGCVLAEPQFNPGLVRTVTEGTGARIGAIDPIGAGLEPGPALYGDVLRRMGAALAACLAP